MSYGVANQSDQLHNTCLRFTMVVVTVIEEEAKRVTFSSNPSQCHNLTCRGKMLKTASVRPPPQLQDRHLIIIFLWNSICLFSLQKNNNPYKDFCNGFQA